MDYRKRLVERKVRLVAKNVKVLLLVGPRQVGKSTLLREMFPDLPLVTFNPSQDILQARHDPNSFLRQF